MQTLNIDRMQERLDELEDSSPRMVTSWIQLNRAIARRGATLISNAAAEARGLVTRTATAVTDEVVDVTDDVATRVEESDADATRRQLEGLTKTEIYQRAQALDIAGRSAMTKEQLINAIVQAVQS